MLPHDYVLPQTISSFHEYFRLTASTQAVVEALGYQFVNQKIDLPRAPEVFPAAAALRGDFEAGLPLLDLGSEMARREYLIAPILFQIALYLRAQLFSEFSLVVSERLQGSLDYLLIKENQLLVVEAKQGDMSRGFKQLAAELAALDLWTNSPTTHLFGAVSVGDVWRFGILDRRAKTITQDVGLYTVPDNLENLLAVLVAVLRGDKISV